MKKLLTSIALAASFAGFLPAVSAAPYTPFGTVFYFDAKRAEYNASHKTITEATVDGSIVPDVARVQTQTIDGVKTVVYVAFDKNMTAVETHCSRRKQADGEDAGACYKNAAKARMYPTISKGL